MKPSIESILFFFVVERDIKYIRNDDVREGTYIHDDINIQKFVTFQDLKNSKRIKMPKGDNV